MLQTRWTLCCTLPARLLYHGIEPDQQHCGDYGRWPLTADMGQRAPIRRAIRDPPDRSIRSFLMRIPAAVIGGLGNAGVNASALSAFAKRQR